MKNACALLYVVRGALIPEAIGYWHNGEFLYLDGLEDNPKCTSRSIREECLNLIDQFCVMVAA